MNRQTMARPTTQTNRRMRGFEPAAGLLRDRIKGVGEKRGFAVTKLLTHWAEIAGEDLAAVTRPVKVGYGREGLGATLSLLVLGAAGPMVQMQLPRLRERVNATYGYNAIARISLTQTAPAGFAEGQAEFAPAKPKPAPLPEPAVAARATETAAGVQDDRLREALQALGSRILTRAGQRKDQP
jgi:hypothetical protein